MNTQFKSGIQIALDGAIVRDMDFSNITLYVCFHTPSEDIHKTVNFQVSTCQIREAYKKEIIKTPLEVKTTKIPMLAK